MVTQEVKGGYSRGCVEAEISSSASVGVGGQPVVSVGGHAKMLFARLLRWINVHHCRVQVAQLVHEAMVDFAGHRLTSFRLGGPYEGAGGRDLAQGLALLLGIQSLYGPGIVGVRHLYRDPLESGPVEQPRVLVLRECPGDVTGPQSNGLQDIGGQCSLVAEENDVRDGEASARLEDPEGLGDHGGLVGGEVYDAVGDHYVYVVLGERNVLDLAL